MVTKIRNKAKNIKTITVDIKAAISLAKDNIKDVGVYGISGPELGFNEAFFVVKKSLDFNFRQVYINPKIIEKSSNNEYGEEGCNALPGIRRTILRPENVTIRAQDEKLNTFDTKLSGFSARLAQHLIDHVNGITILDKE